jgi:hypothetical protein
MPLITLPTHFDGEKICLDEPYSLRPNIKLMVVVLSEQKDDKKPSSVRLGDLPEIFRSLPHFSETEAKDFEKDIDEIKATLSDYSY